MKPFDVYPVFDINIVKGERCSVWDDKGTKYMDLYGGHAVISVGHSHPSFIDALTKQAGKLAFYSNSVKTNYNKSWQNAWGECPNTRIINFFW